MITKKNEDHEAPVTSGGVTVSIQSLKGTWNQGKESREDDSVHSFKTAAPDAIL